MTGPATNEEELSDERDSSDDRQSKNVVFSRYHFASGIPPDWKNRDSFYFPFRAHDHDS